MFDLSRIQDWYDSEVGRLISRAIEQHVWKITACVFGYHAIQIGEAFPGRNLLKNCTIRNQIIVDRSSAANIISSPAALPVTSDSIDLFVLAHTLDFTDKPHQILREVERCLVTEGYVIIIGFNPHSFYGLWRRFPAHKKIVPWNAKFYSIRRIRDWSSLLGFDETALHFTAHVPPFKRIQKWKKIQAINVWLQNKIAHAGGIYIFVARKRLARLTPLEQAWPVTNRILTSKLPKPTVRMREDVESR